jgi:hypothetical protein
MSAFSNFSFGSSANNTPLFHPPQALQQQQQPPPPPPSHHSHHHHHQSSVFSTPRMPRNISSMMGPFAHRTGTVLDSSTLIKIDDYPREEKKKETSWNPAWFPKRISGADKIRMVPGTGILGVAQPTVHGVRGMLNALGAGRSSSSSTQSPDFYELHQEERRKVLWINLREEPLLYVNGRSVVLREVHEPFHNIEVFRGISESRLRELEYRLKEDVVAEAQRCGGNVLLHEEHLPTVLEEIWEAVPPDCVMTPEEVFFKLRVEGYRVQYVRVPTTSGRSPNPTFFDHLLDKIVRLADRSTWIVFNCQTGLARSTLAMVAACQLQHWRGFISSASNYSQVVTASFETSGPGSPPSPSLPPNQISSQPRNILKRPSSALVRLESPMPTAGPRQVSALSSGGGGASGALDQTEKGLLAGWYQPVLQMVRLLVGGGEFACCCCCSPKDSRRPPRTRGQGAH